jgi:hypothetical protein
MSDDTQIGYDIIGDVHGHADKLEGLLRKMDYELIDGTWQHPERQVIFVGDLIDRGPRQVDSVMIAKRMVEGGHAYIVMGNHEFNAIAYATPNPNKPGDFLRTHQGEWAAKNFAQHQKFLEAVVEGSELHREVIQWFKSIPLWLELEGLRIIHACWDPASMDRLRPKLGPNNTVTDELMVTMSKRGHDDYEDLEILIKGPEIEMPEGLSYKDKDGITRRSARFAWWDPEASTFDVAARIPGNCTAIDGTPFPTLPAEKIPSVNSEPYGDTIPLFFGHYWCTDGDEIISDHAMCVDYSAGKGGPLKAYRWNGESKLDPSLNLVSFP